MAYKEKEIIKKYYSISEVAKTFNVATSLIRFWETEFDVIKPRKNSKGNRQFTQEDIENIKQVYHLVKEKGYTLQGAKDILKTEPATPIATAIIPSNKSKESAETLKSLLLIRSFLVEIQQQL
jgi:DNA-binding transcriptional MerR regulator